MLSGAEKDLKMISVFGTDGTPEYEAAFHIAMLARRAWPWLEDDSVSFLTVFSGLQCHGQLPRDIDVFVVGYFTEKNEKYFMPSGPLTVRNGSVESPKKVRVDSLFLVIEVKDHDPSRVRFFGPKVEVRYNSGWHDATEQSIRQLYSFKNYLEFRRFRMVPRITNLIWLRNLLPHQIPSPPHNILHGNLTWNGLLNQAAATSQIIKVGKDEYVLSALKKSDYDYGPSIFNDVIDAVSVKLEPSALDRMKMDAMSREALDKDIYALAGSKLLLFKGHGGTGKTMLLLQVAHKACGEGRSALLLTYNKALVADIRRTMALAGISDEFGSGSIQAMTVHSFFHQLLKDNDILSGYEEDFLEEYLPYLDQLAEKSRKVGITHREWDLIFIDEAQDWPDIERQLLIGSFGPERLVVADGMQQLVRRQSQCIWKQGLDQDFYEEVSLSKGYRMKRNIADFTNCIAQAMGLLDWHVDEKGDAYGGNVIVVEGAYFNVKRLHASILEGAESMGNSPVDLLACVPPIYGLAGFDRVGQQIWDGTSSVERGGYPTSLRQLRVVQYESCRGLEGWVAINLGFDTFIRMKMDEWEAQLYGVPGDFRDDTYAARRFAARWAMIALTRAIDTIVIELKEDVSEAKSLLTNLYEGPCKDFMEWIHA